MKLAFLTGPYRAKTEWAVEQNIARAEAAALALWQKGYAVICPHKNSAHFGGAMPDATWLAGDLVMLSRCDLVVVLPGWEDSAGSRGEVARAGYVGIPILTLEEALS